MNIRDTLCRIFPAGMIKDGDLDLGDSFEVHGLPKNSVPKNCEILASGQFVFSAQDERRESYLVKAHNVVIFFRIGPAPPDSGYAEFASGYSQAPTEAVEQD